MKARKNHVLRGEEWICYFAESDCKCARNAETSQ